MITMIIKMMGVTLLYVLLTALIWKRTSNRQLTRTARIAIGVIYGLCSVLSTHFGINYGQMLLNVRDIGPLAAGLFFSPSSGIIAGLIGGIERYIAGTYWDVGAYTRIACAISTCLAGFLAAAMNLWILKGKKPSEVYAFFMGAVMEVFHMYVVFITHRSDMTMALYVVQTCAPAMIFFTGIGMAASASVLRLMAGEWRNPFRHIPRDEVPVSRKFQKWLFIVTILVLFVNFFSAYFIQTQTAVQEAENDLEMISGGLIRAAEKERDTTGGITALTDSLNDLQIGNSGTADAADAEGYIIAGTHRGQRLPESLAGREAEPDGNPYFFDTVFDQAMIGRLDDLGDGMTLVSLLPAEEIYASRDAQSYETALGDILLFTVIYFMISLLVQQIVVRNLALVNASLGKITGGDLNEVVNVRDSSEFASLSDDINQTVDVLKGYIEAAEKRIEQELEFARTIQDSALPKNFTFPRNDFALYATMDPAKEVGGDFYDFFFVDQYKLALVIADVSGKGIPAALFMMRAKTAIRGMAESGRDVAEIMFRANRILSEGNEAEMFVTAWMGIIDLRTGVMRCANAGHEYPAIRRAGGDFELMKDRHGLALAAMEGIQYREYELEFRPGDQLFVYTDGLPEAINPAVEAYGNERMISALNAVKGDSMEELLHAVEQDLAAFVGEADQFDDTTMLGFVYHGPREN